MLATKQQTEGRREEDTGYQKAEIGRRRSQDWQQSGPELRDGRAGGKGSENGGRGG